jgi:Transposase and inactivated derivatives
MKYNQNEKIMQITEETLIVGVDIASELHYARAFDFRGMELAKVISFSNDIEGFEQFSNWVKDLQLRHKKVHVMVGMEPTGHYWFNFAQHLKDHNIKLVLVNPFHVKRSKELDDNNPTKSDRKDPKTIAMLVKDGRYMIPYIPEGIYSELRVAMENRRYIVNQLNSVRNRVQRWIKIYFPEFNTVFGDWEGKAALVILREFPTPRRILDAGIEGIIARWKKDKIRAVGRKRAVALVEAATKSVGVREGSIAAQIELENLLDEYDLKIQQYERIMSLVEQLAHQIPGLDAMLKIKGVGLVVAAGFVAEVGDVSRFNHPKQIQKLAGLSLKEDSSGKHKGQTVIAKRGRRLLRSLLFLGIMPIVSKNKEFRELHRFYTTRENNPLKKKQSLILLCCKLIRVFFALLKKGVAYDPQKMMSDIKRPMLQQVA